MIDLFAPRKIIETLQPWRPHPLAHEEWPAPYERVFQWRMETLAKLRADPDMLASACVYYSTRPGEFIADWMDTYDPRKQGSKWVPFIPFSRQGEFVAYLHELRTTNQSGLVEKARDMGATWLSCAYSVWSWLFIPNDAIGWGSRKQELVDKIGDASSIFEKIRLIIRRLPDIWQPEGLKPRDHLTFMKCINPANGSVITGETGDNIGRGGRTSMYFKDESAHYERPEKIEAALGDNTNVQIDISSVNGLGNVFHRRRQAGEIWKPGHAIEPGKTRVFIIDWRDHPEKTQEWYDTRKSKAEREGMQHLFAQEVDRNYSAAIQNTIINREWIIAAHDAHYKIPALMIAPDLMPNKWMAGLDVADGGIDRNALAVRQWVILRSVEEWGARDQGVTMRRVVERLRPFPPMEVQADLIGVGAGVKTEYNRLVEEKLINPRTLKLVFWNAGAAVTNPFDRTIPGDDESPTNKDMFANFKAQAWWALRARFYKTWRAVTMGDQYPADELISLDSEGLGEMLLPLTDELAQPTHVQSTGLRTMIDKKPDGTRSPNMADSVVSAFFPAPDTGGYSILGSYNA